MYSLDLLILPLVRSGGQDQPSVPGLYVASRPRHAARFRNDELAYHITLRASSPFSADQTNDLLDSLAKTYFSTSGSVTAAQRAVAEALNQFLFDRNTRSGHRAIGLLTQVVLRADRLHLAQSGPLHALFLSSGELQDFHDPVLAGEGLGLDSTIAVYFSQVELNANDALVLTAEPPSTWTMEPWKILRSGARKFTPPFTLKGRTRFTRPYSMPNQAPLLRLLRPVRSKTWGSQHAPMATPLPGPVQTEMKPAPTEAIPQSQLTWCNQSKHHRLKSIHRCGHCFG
jgi:hypothetical protein